MGKDIYFGDRSDNEFLDLQYKLRDWKESGRPFNIGPEEYYYCHHLLFFTFRHYKEISVWTLVVRQWRRLYSNWFSSNFLFWCSFSFWNSVVKIGSVLCRQLVIILRFNNNLKILYCLLRKNHIQKFTHFVKVYVTYQ